MGDIRDRKLSLDRMNILVFGVDRQSYYAFVFVISISRDQMDDFMEVYPIKEAYAIMAIATIRIIKPSVSNR